MRRKWKRHSSGVKLVCFFHAGDGRWISAFLFVRAHGRWEHLPVCLVCFPPKHLGAESVNLLVQLSRLWGKAGCWQCCTGAAKQCGRAGVTTATPAARLQRESRNSASAIRDLSSFTLPVHAFPETGTSEMEGKRDFLWVWCFISYACLEKGGTCSVCL